MTGPAWGTAYTPGCAEPGCTALRVAGSWWVPEGYVSPRPHEHWTADDETTAVQLVKDAFFLRQNGERPPGAPHYNPEAETWRDWDRRAEAFLRAQPGLPHVEVIYQESWRAEIWEEEIPSREGWQVHCAEHGLLGSPAGWAYENSRSAHMVATRHRRKHAEG